MEIIKGFFSDARVMTILGLILLDVLLAIAAAIRTGTFELRKIGEFYKTMVVPYVIGYMAFYLAATFFLDPEKLGPWADLAGDGMLTITWLALVGTLAGDVIRSAKALAYKIEDDS